MTDIWQKIGDKWSRARPSAFLNEQELHDRIVEAPEMLPLSGQPQIVAAYREVPLGGGKADVLAFEASGRPVVIEVKLSQNAEARRAVVAQALAYAAALRGETVEKLETDILSTHLQEDEHSTLAEASEEHAVDREEFYGNLKEHLAKGSFRIVFVLDDAPLQLVRLTGYLELIADRITVDLVTVRSYQVGDTHILLPQRVDPERLPEAPPAQSSPASQSSVSVTAGSEDFREAISGVADESQSVLLHKCADWADKLAEEGLCRLHTAVGNKNASLQPRLLDRQVSIANPLSKSGNAYLRIHESVISKQAPAALSAVKAARKEENTTKDTKEITDQLLDALTEAYREAAGKE